MSPIPGGTPPLNWSAPTIPIYRAKASKWLEHTNWQAICERASLSNGGQPCIPLSNYTCGGLNLARLLQFEDGTHWVARVPLAGPTPEAIQKLRTEIDAMMLLRKHTTVVPQIYAFELGDTHKYGTVFVLLEFLPGNTAMDEACNHEKEPSYLIPRQYQRTLHQSLASAHAQIASVRLPKIGTVVRNPDGSFGNGPIPGIGGPFDTAGEFMRAWAEKMKCPWSDDYLRDVLLPPKWFDEVMDGLKQFPAQLAKLAAADTYFTTPGPFPIRHADFFHSNVVVNTSFEVLGVIDWDGAVTLPWELIDPPQFIKNVPRIINPPEDYDEAGQPLDQDEARRWAEEEAYVDMVRESEERAGLDHKLSETLANRKAQDLANTIHLYVGGKMGFYAKVLDNYP